MKNQHYIKQKTKLIEFKLKVKNNAPLGNTDVYCSKVRVTDKYFLNHNNMEGSYEIEGDIIDTIKMEY